MPVGIFLLFHRHGVEWIISGCASRSRTRQEQFEAMQATLGLNPSGQPTKVPATAQPIVKLSNPGKAPIDQDGNDIPLSVEFICV